MHWYDAGGEEKEVCFDSLQELGKFLRENPRLCGEGGVWEVILPLGFNTLLPPPISLSFFP